VDVRKIAIVGKMRSGKSTLAKMLTNQGFERFAFADPVKEASAEMLTAFVHYLDTDSAADYTVDDMNRMKGHPAIRGLLQLAGTELGRDWHGPDSIWIDLFEKRVNDHIRSVEATNAGSFFVDRAGNKTDPFSIYIVCDDCRFSNEAERLREMDFLVVKLVRDEYERLASVRDAVQRDNPDLVPYDIDQRVEKMLSHPSETNVDLIEADFNMRNGSIAHLELLAGILTAPNFDKKLIVETLNTVWAVNAALDNYLELL
jgi:hypothetical protein